MIEYLELGLQYCLGIVTLLSFIILVYCLYNKQEINTWQFPIYLALFLDSILIFYTLHPSQIKLKSDVKMEDNELPKGKSPHLLN